ncbi:FAD binding domain-containing protein [Daedaleopsis nitida]|nr:FAD binding domain-containing protein [Daedaleopsis nitida]
MSPKESFVDVLVIGAGPAGVMCANALVHAGVSVRVVDKRPVGLVAGQADACMPRTLEVLNMYGLADAMLKKGEHVWKSAYYNPSKDGGIERTAQAPLNNVPTARWPFTPMCHQGGMEDIFLDSMSQKGLEVERATIPTAIELSEDENELKDPDAYVAKVTIKHLEQKEDNTEIIRAKFVLGSDGAHSWVRKVLNIPVHGDSSDSIWGVVDIYPDSDFPDIRKLTFVHSRHGTLLIIPRENSLIRLYIQQPTADFIDPNTGRVDKERTTPQMLLAHGQKILQPYRMEATDDIIAWWTVYVVGQRVAEKYAVHDRVFIAGDACHTHSPKAGQGMNTSMGDTHNLAWKIVYALRGWADPSLLTTYEEERRTLAQNLIEFDRAYSKLFAGKPRTEENQDGVSHDEFFGMHKTMSGFVSGIGIRYGPSVIVDTAHQSLAANLIIGERVLPHVFIRAADTRPFEIQDLLPADTRFKILVFGGDIKNKADYARLEKTAEQMNSPNNFVRRFGRPDAKGMFKAFDFLCFTTAEREAVDYLDYPEFFRPHWSKVLIDAPDMHNRQGGGGYAKYGIDKHAGAIVVVRPDGYIALIAPLDGIDHINAYFSAFLIEGL